MKIFKLNEEGVAHWLVGVLVVALIAAVGVKVLTSSNADSPTSATIINNNEMVYDSTQDSNFGIYTSTDTGPPTSIPIKNLDLNGSEGSVADYGNGERIYYLNGVYSNLLYSASFNGQHEKLVAKLPVTKNGEFQTYSGLEWSSPANKFAVVYYQGSYTHPTVYTMNANGKDLTEVYASNTLYDPVPLWSPNGTKIFLAGGNLSILINIGTYGNIENVNDGCFNNDFAEIAWTTDSNSLLCVADVGTAGAESIVSYNLSTKAQTILYSVPPYNSNEINSLTVSDKGQLAFSTAIATTPDGNSSNFNCQINEMPAGSLSGTPTTIDTITNQLCDVGMSWSPNGSELAFISRGYSAGDQNPTLYVYNASGQIKTIATATVSISNLSWSYQNW